MIPKISILVSARKNSKYLAKLLFSYLENTFDSEAIEVFVMLNKNDTWNKELQSYFEHNENIYFFTEDMGLGRGGLHLYFNKLLKHADSEWVLYVCDDHQFILPDWDLIVADKIEELKLNPEEPWCLIPKFDNTGAMNQIVSKGYINALGGVLGRHGNIDSYINDVNRGMGAKHDRERIVRFDEEMFHDFTADIPSPMEQAPAVAHNAHTLNKYNSEPVQKLIEIDSARLKKVLDEL